MVTEAHERIVYVFNNACADDSQNSTVDYDSNDLRRFFSVNPDCACYGAAAVSSVMHCQRHDAIVYRVFAGDTRSVGNQPSYAASKHGVVGQTCNGTVKSGRFGIQIDAIVSTAAEECHRA